MKFSKLSTFAFVCCAFVLTSCASGSKTYSPSPNVTAKLTATEAKRKLPDLLSHAYGDFNPCRGSYEVGSHGIRVICNDGTSFRYNFADTPNPTAQIKEADFPSVYTNGLVELNVPNASKDPGKSPEVKQVSMLSLANNMANKKNGNTVSVSWTDHNDMAKEFVDAWQVLVNSEVTNKVDDTSFSEVARVYLATNPKPKLPEEAFKFSTQAQFAVEQKRFDDAVNLFSKALDIAPWWPTGYYNRALILAQLGEYQDAVISMKRYLMLAPNANDARAAQIKIYQWESATPAK